MYIYEISYYPENMKNERNLSQLFGIGDIDESLLYVIYYISRIDEKNISHH